MHLRRILFLLGFIMFLTPFTGRSEESNPYASALPSIPAKDVGIYIEDLRTGDVILDVNGEKLFTPASVTKLVTTSTALNTSKPGTKFVTEVVAQGNIKNGVLEGNLVIKAVGDPTIESRHFPANKGFAEKVAVAVKQKGITRITGTVVARYKAEYEQPTPAGWMDEDLIHPYGTEFHAVNYADNVVSLSMPSGRTIPETPGLTVKRTGRNRRARGTTVVEATASQQIANPVPESTLCRAVEKALEQQGVQVGDTPVADSGKSVTVYSHTSPTMLEIITSLMHRSDNLMAEGMLRATAPGKTRNEATKRELEFWRDKGVDTNGIVIEDGSGLSRNNKISPYFLAEVLDWMRVHKNNNNQYVNIFPVAGKSGTMRGFLKGTKLEGKIAAKTGSMRNVQCYAGFKLDDNGQPTHLVVLLLNNFSDRAKLKKALEKLLLDKLS
ncbi:MAG: D-alanyl-D-alanine carboxypeptidase/D-alanyl-D-alanine-endopeptidase [Bacteroides sp.]|nr:D-alanyl-D-alanine carboxypeptidase/D-alanyl-D-alanine-endopeptidase [Bacteroides sp.]